MLLVFYFSSISLAFLTSSLQKYLAFFGVNRFYIESDWRDTFSFAKSIVIEQMMKQVLVNNVILILKCVFLEFLKDFLSGNLVNDSVSVEPFELSVDFFKGSFPIGSFTEFILVII